MRGAFLVRTLLLALAFLPLLAQSGRAEEIGNVAFQRAWSRTDQPVAAGRADRTWVWGPAPFADTMIEPYLGGTTPAGGTGSRQVQYFDKARMEITDAKADLNSPSYVTNGLLAKELITGRMQLGDRAFADFAPASINVAGDPHDPEAPTYASFTRLSGYQPIPSGWRVTQTLDRKGLVGDDPTLASYNVTAAHRAAETNHNVASVFWNFMNSTGTVFETGQYARGGLFPNPFSVTGYPISEAYWVNVKLGGTTHRVLVQAFERRILTYTPDNPDGWKVEAGNVGRHYYEWRYGSATGTALQAANVSSRRDSDGHWIFLGEMRNETRAAYENARVTITLFDRTNKQVATTTSYTDFSVVEASERLPFRVWFDTGIDYDHLTVVINGTPSARSERPSLSITAGRAQPLLGGSYRVTNTVRNDDLEPINRPAYVVALYDGAGRVVDYISGFATLSSLPPGAATDIEVTFYNPPQPFSHYTAYYSD